MTDFEMMQQMFDYQDKEAIDSGNWRKCSYEVRKDGNSKDIVLPGIKIGFSFTLDGKFEGIWNYKE